MFENKKPIYYVKAKNGKMEVYDGKDETGKRKIIQYDYVSGRLIGISYRESEYNGEIIKAWNIKLQDVEGLIILSVGYSSGFTRSLINSLANCDFGKPVKVGCYISNDFNCPSVIQDEKIVRWKYDDMPKTEKVTVGSKTVINDEKAIEWMKRIVDEINVAVAAKEHEELPPVIREPIVSADLPDIDDLPF